MRQYNQHMYYNKFEIVFLSRETQRSAFGVWRDCHICNYITCCVTDLQFCKRLSLVYSSPSSLYGGSIFSLTYSTIIQLILFNGLRLQTRSVSLVFALSVQLTSNTFDQMGMSFVLYTRLNASIGHRNTKYQTTGGRNASNLTRYVVDRVR